jgi:ribonuclease D
MTSLLPPPIIIASQRELRELARRIQDEPLVAVDTESNSLYAYRERVCLIQFSTRTTDWLVDPLAIDDLSDLAPFFADTRIEKVFHAAEYDVMCMKRDFDFAFNNLFDTMVAARIIGRKAIGLGNMLEEFFGIQVDKRFQRADWSMRPIPPEQLKYAQQDTHYLLALRDILLDLLQQRGYLTEAREVFTLLQDVPSAVHSFDPEGYWRINAARDFTRREMAVLRELYLFRNQLAERQDRPPFKVFSDTTLTNIVKAMPYTLPDLEDVTGLNRGQIARYGNALLRCVQRGHTAPLPPRPERGSRMDPATQARYDALHEWRKTRAAQRGVESDVILPKEALLALARTPPHSPEELETIPGLGLWKRNQYGTELLQLLGDVAQQDS